jgi:hypothetical protein
MNDPIRPVGNRRFLRIPVKTHIVTDQDDILDVLRKYTGGVMQPGDVVTVSEKVVAITQGRAYPIATMKVGFWAGILWRFVRKVPYGIGLRSRYSMQCAIEEVGVPRILLAAVIGGLTRALGRRGDFYRIAGKQAAMVDAAHTAGLKQYYESVIKGPKDPEKVAQQIADALGAPAAIVDVNDIGGSWVVGGSRGLETRVVEEAMRDNPAGQRDACTPIILLRELTSSPSPLTPSPL